MKKIILGLLILTTAFVANAKTGKEIYSQFCIVCHGPDGKGAIPGAANFTLENGPISKSDKVLLDHIINGFQSPGSAMAMPARGGNPSLTDDELKATLTYIRQTYAPAKYSKPQ